MKTRGFTLIELMVVIAIIGILSAIIIAALQSARTSSQNTAESQQVKQYVNAMMLYYEANGSWPLIGYTNGIYYGCFDQTTCINTGNSVPSDTAAWSSTLQQYISSIVPISQKTLYYFGLAYAGLWSSCTAVDVPSNKCYQMQFIYALDNSTNCGVSNATGFTDASTHVTKCIVTIPY